MKVICSALLIMLLLCLVGCAVAVPEQQETIGQTVPYVTEQTDPNTSEPTVTEPVYTMPVPEEPEDGDFVRVRDYLPDIYYDLRYATDHNFTERVIYDFDDIWLRYGTVKKLMLVSEKLEKMGLCIMLWDGFRPTAAQFKLWEICPDPTYVSDPNKGFSSHSRGNTVDITVVYADGTELAMPTGFDDFSEQADRDYSDCSEEAAANAKLLEDVMTECGFKPYFGEWWHYTDTQSYPVEELFAPVKETPYYADCNAFINLRKHPDTTAEVITEISVGEEFEVLAFYGKFALVEYRDLRGYVNADYIEPVL